MDPKDKQFYAKWDKARSRGLMWYIVPRAILIGVGIAVVKSFLDFGLFWILAKNGLEDADFRAAVATFINNVAWIDALISFLAFSVLFALICWKKWGKNEARFEALVKQTTRGDLPKSNTTATPRGSKEKFPDFEWERGPAKPLENLKTQDKSKKNK